MTHTGRLGETQLRRDSHANLLLLSIQTKTKHKQQHALYLFFPATRSRWGRFFTPNQLEGSRTANLIFFSFPKTENQPSNHKIDRSRPVKSVHTKIPTDVLEYYTKSDTRSTSLTRTHDKVICPTFTMSSSMCVVETSSAGREYKVRDMAQADFGYV